MDDLPSQCVYQRIIFTLRIANDNVVLRYKIRIGNLTLCGERLTGTRRTKDQAIQVLELLTVYHNHVVGNGVQAVIK